MKWSGVLGAGTPSSRWVQGERSLPASGQGGDTALVAGSGSMPVPATGERDAMGERQCLPCQDDVAPARTRDEAGRTKIAQAHFV